MPDAPQTRFDREMLEAEIELRRTYGTDDDEAVAHALKFALAVVDAVQDEYLKRTCLLCGFSVREDPHHPDCPVAACVDAGLTK